MKPPEGFWAHLEDDNNYDNLKLVLSDGVGEEELWLSALELAGGLAHLEEDELLDPNESAWSHEAVEVPETQVSPYGLTQRHPRPRLEGAYRAAQVELYNPRGLLVLRRVVEDGGDVLEITTPNGSVYTFDYDQIRAYLRPLLPH
jgi:hypothetical protein